MKKVLKTEVIEGIIEVKTGLHIGAGSDVIEIGGMDNPIVRDPRTREPYIPGSSLKGKMRSLIEWKLGKISANGDPCSCGEHTCKVCKVFGTSAPGKTDRDKIEKAKERGITRLIVRDAHLTDEWRKKFSDGEVLTEDKAENSINRITAQANPRRLERVIPGTKFGFEILYRIIDDEDENLLKDVVYEAMKLLEKDYLGGGGSRGNGKIKFLKKDGKTPFFSEAGG